MRRLSFLQLAACALAFHVPVAHAQDIPRSLAGVSTNSLDEPPTVSDSVRHPAGIPKLVGAGLLGAIGGATLGAMAGALIAEPICGDHSADCGLGFVLLGGWAGDLLGVPIAVHRANGRRGSWRVVLSASLVSGIETPLIQIPVVVAAERHTSR